MARVESQKGIQNLGCPQKLFNLFLNLKYLSLRIYFKFFLLKLRFQFNLFLEFNPELKLIVLIRNGLYLKPYLCFRRKGN